MTLPREDDTPLDFIAAQVRAYPPLDNAAIETLLAEMRGDEHGPAAERLVEHHLSVALDIAMARTDRGVEVADLYQEGTLAIFVALAEYAARGGPASGLRAYVEKVVTRLVEAAIVAAEAARASDSAIVRAAELLNVAEVALRHEFAREPTVAELAGALEWPEGQVIVVQAAVLQARQQWDDDITNYLDDEDPSDEPD